MPRFIRLLLGYGRHRWPTVSVLVLSLGLALAYTWGTEDATVREQDVVEIDGVAPTEDAGILGGLATQHLQVEQLRSQIEDLQATIKRLESEAAQPRDGDADVRELHEQMRRLQAQVARANQPDPVISLPPQPPAPDPGIVIRTVRRGQAQTRTVQPPSRQGIQVMAADARVPTTGDRVPYLPPQSYAFGHVIDGYTGLALETGFPLTIAIDQPFLTANHHTVAVSGCRLGALATTEELTARSRASLTNITCVGEDGQTLERPLGGYVTAADNMHGQFAQVFWHERDMVAAFAKSAVPVALVSLFRETRRTVEASSLTGVVTATGNSVAQQVAGRMANIYLDKAEKLASPVVWVPPNAPVYIYITKGTALDTFVKASATSQPTATRLAK